MAGFDVAAGTLVDARATLYVRCAHFSVRFIVVVEVHEIVGMDLQFGVV